MDSRQAFMLYACPALGALVAFCVFISPMRAVLRVQRTGQLGELNPLPYVFMIANGVGWLCYGLYIHDFFVFCSNIAALLLGLFYTMTCSKYAKEQVQDRLRNLLLCICVVFLVVALVFMGANLGPQGDRMLWGVTANAILAVYYVTPLSTLAKVLSTRDSSSLYKPLLVANIANGLLWFAYGLATSDLMLTVPNAFGAGFNFISLAISLIFPAHASKTLSASNCTPNPESMPSWGSRTTGVAASCTACTADATAGSTAASCNGSGFRVERSPSTAVAWLRQAVAQAYCNRVGSQGAGKPFQPAVGASATTQYHGSTAATAAATAGAGGNGSQFAARGVLSTDLDAEQQC